MNNVRLGASPLQVTPMGAPRSEAPTGTFVSALPPETVVTESRVVYVPTPVYRSYPPVYTSVNLGWGWGGGYRHGGPSQRGLRVRH